MAVKKLSDKHIKTYLEMLLEHGEEGLHSRVVKIGFLRYAASVRFPEIEILDLSEAFFLATKKAEDRDVLFTIGRVLRRSAHTLYRNLRNQDEKRPLNKRFLNEV